LNKNTLILVSFTFLLTGFFNNSYAKNSFVFNDTLTKNSSETILEFDIKRHCNDSIIQDIEDKKIYLYGNASIEYGDIKITSNKIVIDWIENTILAVGTKDSTGNIIGNPVFEEGKESFKATEILYNLKSKKCIVKKIITKEGEGYIHGVKVKKLEDNILYLKKGEYTTCNAAKPHYSIRANKIKLIPKKQIVTGPAYLTFFNIPTPLFLPFGYFPNTDKKSSGIIIPSYGESANMGFFLKDGGYYFSLNNYTDLTLKADIYTKGSWSAKNNFRYKKRYKYNGSLNLNYGNIITSEVGFPNYGIKKDFFVRWSHKQDPKADPSVSFSANVNAGSSTYHKNNTFTNSTDYLSNTFTSTINWSKRFEGTPFNLSANLGHNQNTQTHKVNLTLPDISLSMSKIYPFKSLVNKGSKNWYDNIGMRYSMNSKNQISTTDSLLFHNSTLQNFNSGMRHNIPINASFKILKYFTFNQSINLSERWYINQVEKTWNGTEVITDTLNKFTRGSEYNLISSINTKIYGVSQFKKGKIAAFRHVMTPNLSFTYNPGFSDEKFGFYKSVQVDSLGNTDIYSIMQNGIYGTPRKNESGNISFSLGNIFGIKVRSKKDTVEELTKVKLIESLNFSSSYNLFADSFNFNYINLNLRTKLFNKINISYSSVFDPYIIDSTGRRYKFELFENNKIARFRNSNIAAGFNINDKTFTKKKNKEEEEEERNKEETRDFYKIPWNLNVNYTHNLNMGTNLQSEKTSTQTLGFSGNIKITPKWKLGFHSGYDFSDETNQEWWKKFSYTSIDIYRDLHCWELLFHWIPTGYQRSYTLTIRVKADILKDLKLERRKDWIAPEFN